MLDQLFALIANPWFYVVGAAAAASARVGAKRLIENTVDHRFAAKLERHKHDLQLLAEVERSRLQRELAGASLYLQRQHSAAAEIYAAIRVAHGAVSGLFGFQRGLSLEGCNETDVRELLSRFEVTHGKQEELIAIWRRDNTEGAEAIAAHLRDLAVPRAENELQRARNLMYVNEIYFGDATIEAYDAFVAESNKWILRRVYPPERGERVEPVSRETLDSSLARVQETLRAELSGTTALTSPPAAIRGQPAQQVD
jgi:hypothetical protein